MERRLPAKRKGGGEGRGSDSTSTKHGPNKSTTRKGMLYIIRGLRALAVQVLRLSPPSVPQRSVLQLQVSLSTFSTPALVDDFGAFNVRLLSFLSLGIARTTLRDERAPIRNTTNETDIRTTCSGMDSIVYLRVRLWWGELRSHEARTRCGRPLL